MADWKFWSQFNSKLVFSTATPDLIDIRVSFPTPFTAQFCKTVDNTMKKKMKL